MKSQIKEVFISNCKRSPIGKFMGSLASIPAITLGSTVLKHMLDETEFHPSSVDEVIIGNMFGGLGQNPAKQVAVGAGLDYSTISTTINKACSSGMKAVTLASQSIQLGRNQVVVAGGIENMSQVPFASSLLRTGHTFGNSKFEDLLSVDGVFCRHSNLTMGRCSERTIEKYKISRQEQDSFCAESYKRAGDAWSRGFFKQEVVAIEKTGKHHAHKVEEDEEYKKVDFNKIAQLKPAFEANGTITAANASGFNDGASLLVLMSKWALDEYNMKPIAKVLGYADFEVEPVHFGTAPSGAMELAVKRAGLTLQDIDLWEINENFSSIAIVNMKILDLDHSKVNINGGAVALGHPFAASGARILCTLINSLKEKNLRTGCASIPNGGGGATAVVLQVMD
jgi:acetyl-CoA C-acetyltransferase